MEQTSDDESNAQEPSMNLSTLQHEQAIWAKRNFGTVTVESQLLGVMEEVGELAHAVLKAEQGIRGSREQHMEDAADAIGDITIYLCGVATAMGVEMLSAYSAPIEETVFNGMVGVHQYVSELCDEVRMRSPKGSIWRAIRGILENLGNVALALGIDRRQAVTDTWASVSQRDWRKHPEDGR